MTHDNKIENKADENKTAAGDTKKEWSPPQLTVLDIESSTGGPATGNTFVDGVYS
ncbi:MAG: hypothetical protein MI863_05645 [Desulfobacterales bacterium]|nr:hypothetical protein [Desulfobacterales bacterium]